ncbi:MAG: DUF4214 domain-containing protein [Actinomycetota bacterium]
MPPTDERRRSLLPLLLALALVAGALSWIDGLALQEAEAATVRRITLPIHRDHVDRMRWSDTFGAPRSGGRSHIGVDMLGPKMVPMVAARSGVISWGRYNNARGSILTIEDDDGWKYTYIHLNNDTPGTDDGAATCAETFSARLCTLVESDGDFRRGVRVTEGEVIGYVGDGGNAEWTAPHLHFEIAQPLPGGGHVDINPTPSVDAALARLRGGAVADPPPRVAPGQSGFEDHLWYRLHGRYPSSDEEAAFDAAVARDGVWGALAAELDAGSTASMVDRLYLAFFQRYPDTEGIEYWINTRAQGYAMEDIAEWFAESDEFQARYAGTPFGVFLDRLYTDVLGRSPDADGKAYWLDLLQRGEVTRGTIVVYFTESAEMHGLTGQRNELVALTLLAEGRAPTAADVAAWSSLRSSKDRAGALADWYAAR